MGSFCSGGSDPGILELGLEGEPISTFGGGVVFPGPKDAKRELGIWPMDIPLTNSIGVTKVVLWAPVTRSPL